MVTLPQELISLVHHVQLNKAGWWDRATDRLVLAALWQAKDPVRNEDIYSEIEGRCGVKLDVSTIEAAVVRLRQNGTLHQLPTGHLKIAEAKLQEFGNELRISNDIADRVYDRFCGLLRNAGLSLDPKRTWHEFNTKWLYPTICRIGARTYEFLNGQYVDWTNANDLQSFLAEYSSGEHQVLSDLVASFLDPKDADVRAHILRLMDAYFVVESSGMGKDTINALSKFRGHDAVFNLLLDTNVVLSILGLHGEAAREATQSLLDLSRRINSKVRVKLFVLSFTVDEARRALNGELEALSRIRMTPQMARVAVERGGLSEVTTAFARTALNSGHSLSAQDFLSPYIKGLLPILRERGIELHNDRLAERLLEDGDVLVDVNAQEVYEQQIYKRNAKSRSQLKHDIALWHFGNRKRPARVDSPTDAVYWVITEDFRLIHFDRGRRQEDGIPICIHPLTFAQMLQFWIERTPELEEALLGGLRLSLLVPDFNAQAEKATIKILEVLSRFENASDLSHSTMTQLFVDDALRQRLLDAPTTEAEIALIRDAIIDENRRLATDKARADEERHLALQHASLLDTESQTTRTAYKMEQERARELELELVREKEKHAVDLVARETSEIEARRAEDRRRAEAAKVAELTEAFHVLQKQLSVDKSERIIRRFILRWIVMPVMVIILIGIGAWKTTAPMGSGAAWRLTVAVVAIAFALWIHRVWTIAAANADVRNTAWFSGLAKLRWITRWVIGAAATTAVGLAVSYSLRPLTAEETTPIESVSRVDSGGWKTLDSLRTVDQVRALQPFEEHKALQFIPRGTYGFLDISLRNTGQSVLLQQLPIVAERLSTTAFEVHKLRDQTLILLGFMAVHDGVELGKLTGTATMNIVLYPEAFPEANTLVKIPLSRIISAVAKPTAGDDQPSLVIRVRR